MRTLINFTKLLLLLTVTLVTNMFFVEKNQDAGVSVNKALADYPTGGSSSCGDYTESSAGCSSSGDASASGAGGSSGDSSGSSADGGGADASGGW